MPHYYTSSEQLIGNTPMMELCRIEQELQLKARIFAKLEFLNPAGSVKDRVALNMIEDAEKKGLLKEGSVIIEPTSGNTGIGLACVAAARGYRAIIIMPDSMSVERIRTMKAYGAEVILTDGKLGMKGAIEKAEEIKAASPGAIIAGQFVNPANPDAHRKTTAPEIWRDMDGAIDCFVAGVGTGGTITGIGQYLKSKDASIRVAAVEPENSAVLSGRPAGVHGLQGIGGGFIPEVLDTTVYDEIITVTDEEAFRMGRMIGRKEGILVGITSGAALHAAVKLAQREAYFGKNIVVLFPDSGDRYFSSAMFAAES